VVYKGVGLRSTWAPADIRVQGGARDKDGSSLAFRSAITTFPPAAARRLAVASPRPEAPPVTIARTAELFMSAEMRGGGGGRILEEPAFGGWQVC